MIRQTTLALALGVATLAAGCGKSGTQPSAGVAAAVPAPTTVIAATTVPVYAESPGTVAALKSVRVASRLSGFVRELDVDIGDHVDAGALLLAIDDKDVEAQISQARAALSGAQAKFTDADFNYRRYANLYKQEAVSRQQYEAVKRDYAAAGAAVSAAKAAVAQAEAERNYAQVRAPFAGTVTARYVQAGDLATPGKPLLAIEAAGGLQVLTQVTNAAYAKLAVGDPVPVIGTGGRLTATVAQLSPAADPATETHLVKLALPAGAGVASGDFVRVLVPVGTRAALVVPVGALVMRAGIPAVFVVDSQGRAQLRMVRTGERTANGIEITAGLAAGERIVTAPTDAVNNRTPIRREPPHGDS